MNSNPHDDPFSPAESVPTVSLVGGPHDGLTARAPSLGTHVVIETSVYRKAEDGSFQYVEPSAEPGTFLVSGGLSATEINRALAEALVKKHAHQIPCAEMHVDKIEVIFERDSNSPDCEIGAAFVQVQVRPKSRIIVPGA